MKISKYLGTFALLVMLAACSTEDEQVRFAGDEVKVNATIGGESVFTRSNPVGTENEQMLFNDNDQIGISVNGSAAHKYEMKNGVWGVAESGVPMKWEFDADHIAEFKAFYPYSYNNVSNSFDKGQIGIEQNTKEGLALSDYMTAWKVYANIPEDRQLGLYFIRQTARVVIDIENSTFTYKFTDPRVAEIKIYSQLELPATQGADVSAIKAYKVDDSNPKSSWVALVAPNAKDENKDFIHISVKENGTETTKEYYIKGIPNLEEGKSYTYKLTIGKDKAIIDNVTVTDWKEGKVIPGGEPSVVTVASIEASVAEQLATSNTDKNVVLRLPSNASLNLFTAINTAINTAIKNNVVEAGSVNLELRGVSTIPEQAFDSSYGGAPGFRQVHLPDVTVIESYAFDGNSMVLIDAPNVKEVGEWAFNDCKNLSIVTMPKASRIKTGAFYNCSSLTSVSFGALSFVEYQIFYKCNTQNIMLELSSRQAKLEFDGEKWVPTRQSYWDTEDYKNNSFLGYTFNTITRANDQ